MACIQSVEKYSRFRAAYLTHNDPVRSVAKGGLEQIRKIVKIRSTSPVAAGETLQHRRRLSHERVVATLRLRIRTLEEINRELKEQLEAAYGRLAVAQPKLGHYTKRQE